MNEAGKRCRFGGWKKLFSDSIYGFQNQDLHDQLLCYQTYYQSFEENITGGGEVTGLSYPFFVPDRLTPGYDYITNDETEHCGYINDVTIGEDSYFSSFDVGYPWAFGDPDYDDECGTGYPFYYPGSHYTVATLFHAPDVIDEGYPYGDAVPEHADYFSYDYLYCGTYPYTRSGCREAITHLREFKNFQGARKLIAATATRIYALNERTGNWRLLADGLGGEVADTACSTTSKCECSDTRFSSAVIGNYILFVNDFDRPLFWQFDGPNTGCNLWAANPIPELAALNIDRAGCIVEWKGIIWMGSVWQDGKLHNDRLVWSDFNRPLSWIPADNSAAGFQDFGSGQHILRLEVMGDYLFIYTNRSIIQLSFVDDPKLFTSLTLYTGSDALKYKYSLVNLGEAHAYLSEAGCFSMTLTDSRPQRLEWMHRSSAAIFKGIGSEHLSDFPHLDPFGPVNKNHCNQVIGGFNDLTKELWFSWPTDDNVCPNMSLVYNLYYSSAHLVDHGFTAFTNYVSDTRPNVRDFLHEHQVCHFDFFTDSFVKEGIPYAAYDDEFDNPPLYLFNEEEDPNLPHHPQSLCAQLGDLTIRDICETCDTGQVFVMASALDYTLKQFTPDQFYRERYVTEEEFLQECQEEFEEETGATLPTFQDPEGSGPAPIPPGPGPDQSPWTGSCDTGTLYSFESAYVWGLSEDVNPNEVLTADQIACHIATAEIEFTNATSGLFVSHSSQFYWVYTSTSRFMKSMQAKWGSGVCTPNDPTGDVVVGFAGDWTLWRDYCASANLLQDENNETTNDENNLPIETE